MLSSAQGTVINGQLVHIAPKQGYAPLTFGQTYTGPRFDGAGSVFNVPPVIPSPTLMGGTGSVAGGITGLPPATSAGAVNSDGSVNFMHPTKSPLWMALIFLIGGLLMLKYIHFNGK